MLFAFTFAIQKLSDVKDLFNIIVWSISIIGGLYGVINFGKNVKAANKERKIKTFQNRVAQIDRVRPTSVKKCLNEYKSKYQGKIDPNNTLVVKNEWLLPDDQLLDFSNIDVKLVDEQDFNQKTIKHTTLKIFPDKKLNYSELLIKYNESKRSFFNGDIYCTYEIRKENNIINIDIFKSNYFSFVNSCKVLELMNETDQAHKRFKLDILNFKNRHSGIGINAITIFNNVIDEHNNHVSYFALHQRSNTVVESPNSIHVVPAGTYSPMVSIQEFNNSSDGINHFDHDLKNTIYREFLEEVWQSKYMKELGSIRLLQENVKYYILKYFTKVYFLGLGIEPYNTKTEILAALVFNMSGYKDKEIDQIIKGIKEDIDSELKEKIKLEVKRLFKDNYNFNDFDTFFENNQKEKKEYDNVFNEGNIRLEQLTKGILEQYYSDINVTPSAKEIFRKVYHLIDKIKK